MDIKVRRIYYSIFIALFLLAAPVVVLYARGYRYDWQSHSLYRVGAVSLESEPKSADIYLDGQLAGKTNTTIQNLSPGYHSLRLTKPDFLSWQKEIEIRARETAIYHDLLLFKENPEKKLITSAITGYLFSPDRSRLLIQDGNNNYFYWQEGKLTEIYPQLNFDLTNCQAFSWSVQQRYLAFIEQGGQTRIWDSQNPSKLINLSSIWSGSQPEQLVWDSLEENFLYFLADSQVYQINLDNQKAERILLSGTNLLAIQPKGQDILLIDSSNDLPSLISYGKNSQESEVMLYLDPGNYSFRQLVRQKDYLFLDKTDTGETLLIDLAGKELLAQFPVARHIDIGPNRQNYLLQSDYEIWLWQAQTKKKTLLTRYSALINSAALVSDYDYCLFSVNNQLKVIEFDSRNRLTQEIASLSLPREIFLANEKNLFTLEEAPTKIPTYTLQQITIF